MLIPGGEVVFLAGVELLAGVLELIRLELGEALGGVLGMMDFGGEADDGFTSIFSGSSGEMFEDGGGREDALELGGTCFSG